MRGSARAPVAVVGPGAVGGVLAASLRLAGYPVLLAGRGRSILRGPLLFKSPDGRSRAVRGFRTRSTPDCAAVFLCVKSADLRSALPAVRRLAGPRAPVVSLLNGLAHPRPLRKAFAPSRLVFSAFYAGCRRLGPASVWHTGGRRISLARTRANAAAADSVRRILESAGWRTAVVRSEERLLWTKAVVNAAMNPIGALTRGTNASLARHPAMRDLLTQAVREAAAVARAAGHPHPAADPAAAVLRAIRGMENQYNSMVQDLEAGRRTEADAILKPMTQTARRTRTPVPTLEPLYLMIRRLEKEVRP
jgi:2-dehydropantoate 2-reductase